VNAWPLAIDWILEAEGGYSCDPRDPGGATNFGISQRAYPTLDIKNLTKDQAEAIYARDYWTPIRAAEMPAAWAITLFDAAVLQGRWSAVMTLQSVLGLRVDGSVGPVTLSAVANASERDLARYFLQRSNQLRQSKAAATYASGWTVRLFRLALRCGAISAGATT
jgi:lysozyme family protein